MGQKVYQRHLTNDEKAFHPVILGIITFTVVAILFGILVMVYSEIQPSIIGSDQMSNKSIEKVTSNVYTGFNLGSITPILLVTTLITTSLLGMLGITYAFSKTTGKE